MIGCYLHLMGSENLHERDDLLSDASKNMHRAIVSLMEEFEAIDWYQQRAEACTDDELRSVLVHNKNEEIEHAMMVLEWMRRHNPDLDKNIRTYLMTEGPITAVEDADTGGSSGGSGGQTQVMAGDGSLSIGSLRGA